MMFKSTLLVAAVAITSSNAFAFQPNSRIPSTFAARTMDVSPSSFRANRRTTRDEFSSAIPRAGGGPLITRESTFERPSEGDLTECPKTRQMSAPVPR